MSSIETVLVVRKDHPYGKVVINKCDLTESDEIYVDGEALPSTESDGLAKLAAKQVKK